MIFRMTPGGALSDEYCIWLVRDCERAPVMISSVITLQTWVIVQMFGRVPSRLTCYPLIKVAASWSTLKERGKAYTSQRVGIIWLSGYLEVLQCSCSKLLSGCLIDLYC